MEITAEVKYMDKEKLQLIIREYNKSKIQSEQEVRSKLIVPLLELLEYPSELRAEEYPIYGFEGFKKLPVKMVDFLLFSDPNFSFHRNYAQEDLNWVQNHSLLVIEAKKPGEIPSVLGQPLYYTMWSKAVAYLVIDGEYIKGYYYNEFVTDRKIIDCKLNELLEHDEVWEFCYNNIRSIKERESYNISTELSVEQKHEENIDMEIEAYLFGDKNKGDIACKSTLEEEFEKVEVENFMQRLKEDVYLLNKENEQIIKNVDEILSLVPYEYNHNAIIGKHFTLPNYNGMITVVYEVVENINYNLSAKYYTCEPLDFADDIVSENEISARTFFIDYPKENGNQLILLFFDKDNNKSFITTGILFGDSVKILKSPSVTRFQILHFSDEMHLSSTSYDLESYSNAKEKSDIYKNSYEEIWHEIDINLTPPIIIDPNTVEQVQREVYYDEKKKCLKARIKLKPYKSYFTFQIISEDSEKFIPLSSLEMGKYFKNGQNGFPRDLYEAIRNFEDDGSAEAFFEIACIFRDEISLKNDDMFFKYLCKSADLKYDKAVVELALCVYNNETSIKEFKECVLLLSEVVNDDYALGNYILAYFTELCLIENKSSKDAFELYVKAALKDYKPAQVRLNCNSKMEIEISETNELLNCFMDSMQKRSGLCSYCIGSVYYFGIGIRKRKQKGLDLLLEAGYCGNIYAQYTLFEIFDIDNVYIDKKEATQWLEIISKSTTSVYTKLSNRLLDGVGCEVSEENDRYAFSLLQKAALELDKTAINNLGWMYKVGRGCTINYERALELFDKAASLGNGTSFFHLGNMYEKGLGVKIDIDKAKEYYSLAIEMGNEKAKQYLENIK